MGNVPAKATYSGAGEVSIINSCNKVKVKTYTGIIKMLNINTAQIALNIQNGVFGNISLVAQQALGVIESGINYYFAFDNSIDHRFYVTDTAIVHFFSGNNALKQVAGIEVMSVVPTETLAVSRSIKVTKEETLFYKLKYDTFTDDERVTYANIITLYNNLTKKE